MVSEFGEGLRFEVKVPVSYDRSRCKGETPIAGYIWFTPFCNGIWVPSLVPLTYWSSREEGSVGNGKSGNLFKVQLEIS